MLRAKLSDQRIAPRAFRRILGILIDKDGFAATEIGLKVIRDAVGMLPGQKDRSIQAAVELLSRDPSRNWRVIWPIMQKDPAMCEAVIAHFDLDPYSSDTTRLLGGLCEDELAELHIWLSQRVAQVEGDNPSDERRVNGFTVTTSIKPWRWLETVVMSALIERGTPDAVKAIRGIDKKAPDPRLKRVERAAEEMFRRKTWTPPSPAEFLTVILAAPAGEVPKTEGKHVDGKPGKQKLAKDPMVKVKETIRQLKEAAYGQQEICSRLGDQARPKNAAWSPFTWPAAFRAEEYRGAVKSWISRVK